jgi:hypothetical protein
MAYRELARVEIVGDDGDVPWCAIWANAALEQSSVPGTRSASSQSFRCFRVLRAARRAGPGCGGRVLARRQCRLRARACWLPPRRDAGPGLRARRQSGRCRHHRALRQAGAAFRARRLLVANGRRSGRHRWLPRRRARWQQFCRTAQRWTAIGCKGASAAVASGVKVNVVACACIVSTKKSTSENLCAFAASTIWLMIRNPEITQSRR